MTRFQYFTVAAALALGVELSLTQAQSSATAFHLAERSGRPVLASPGGDVLWVRALNHVHLISTGAPSADLAPVYIDQRSSAILAAMRRDGFNALGGDADAELWHRGVPYILSLHLTQLLEGSQSAPMVDVYAPDFSSQVAAMAMDACPPRAHDASLLGYVSDDSLPWDPAEHAGEVLGYYLQLPLQTPGRQRALDYLRDRYGSDIARLNRAWGLKAKQFLEVTVPPHPSPAVERAVAADAARFAQDVLVRYLQTAADAIHAADPNHLFLGANLEFDPDHVPPPGSAEATVWTIANVNSVMLRTGQDASAVLAALGRLSPRPVLAQWRGCDAAPPVAALVSPLLIGYTWSPDGDWESGRCGQAARVWGQVISRKR